MKVTVLSYIPGIAAVGKAIFAPCHGSKDNLGPLTAITDVPFKGVTSPPGAAGFSAEKIVIPPMEGSITASGGEKSPYDSAEFREFFKEVFLHGIKGIKALGEPDAGFFQVLDLSAFRGKYYGRKRIENGIDFFEQSVIDAGACMLPGEVFAYPGHEMTMRASFSFPPHEIVEGMFRIAGFIKKLKDHPYDLPSPSVQQKGRTI